MGQGQTEKAIANIETAQRQGYWVYLQNCHLVPSFMKPLEQIIIKLQNNYMEYNPDFRLWISGLSSPNILPSILMNSAKVTVESPSGLKQNLMSCSKKYQKLYAIELEMMKKQNKHFEFNKLLISLIHFHAIVVERKNYGPIGWNIAYNFNESDFNISKEIIRTNLLKNDIVPYKALTYLTADCIYGGRVTDDWDKVTMNALLGDLYSKKNIDSASQAVNDSEFIVGYTENYEDLVTYIVTRQDEAETDCLGLHRNAFVKKQAHESLRMLEIFQKTSASGTSGNLLESLVSIEELIRKSLPVEINVEAVKLNFPILYENSFNSILVQEIMRYNRLLKLVYDSVHDALAAYKGTVPLSEKLEAIARQVSLNKTPLEWVNSSYPSVKPLTNWISDLNKRIEFFKTWIEKGTPEKFWFSAFYFSQAFLTGIKQNYARSLNLSIDSLDFNVHFLKKGEEKQGKGEYVYGLFIEGAEWDYDSKRIDEIKGKGLMFEMPHFIIEAVEKAPDDASDIYWFSSKQRPSLQMFH